MRILSGLLALFLGVVHAQSETELNGHFKYRFNGFTNPDSSVFRELSGDTTVDHGADLRLNLAWRGGNWDGRADYQLIGLKGDAFEIGRNVPQERLFLASRIPTDDRRLFDLTHIIEEGEDYALLHRLDRLWLSYTSDNATLRAGRQAISWGNGLIYTPMDFFNPFDPAAVDKEYKPGDDMVYGQHAFDRGDDMQGVVVARRDLLTGDVEADVATFALKYHGFRRVSEFDLLAARHYGDTVIAAGGNREVGGAVVRGDVVLTRTDDDTVLQLVANATHSWTWWDRNVSGIVEYFYNGFGQSDGDYSPEALLMNPDLLQRIARGELFTLARHYVVGSATVEVTPLLLVTPNLFMNLSDGSALLQVVLQRDLRQDVLLLGAFTVPFGPDGTEFGGIESGEPGTFLSTGPGLFLQVAAYF